MQNHVHYLEKRKEVMNIIGVSGLAGSGKDTVADMILQNKGFIKVSLADPIKRFAMDVWGFTEEQVFGASQFRNAPDPRYETSPGNFLTPRLALQNIGTEGVRAIDHDAWIRYAIRTAKTLLSADPYQLAYSPAMGVVPYMYYKEVPYDYYGKGPDHFPTVDGFPSKVLGVVIADVRFKNEIKGIKEAGGKLVRVIRPGAGLQGSFALHQSEAEMAEIPDSEFDSVIQNTGTLDDLKKSVDDFVTTLLHKNT
jgi:hypothetical protein